MKRLLFILLFLAQASFILAQGNTAFGNFKIDEQELIYQKIFLNDSITSSKLADYYKTLPFVSNVSAKGDEITFNLNELVVDYKKFQFTQVATPSIIQTGKYSGYATVGVKDGRYRVTVREIVLTGDIGYKKITNKEPLTSFACKNNGTIMAQDWCRPNMLGLLDQAFTDKLQFVELKKKKTDDKDW
ncbi:hypothetical protein WBG78_26855 [Chryseolinea sp. T2]|uniref:hypothetical protein n=1 Tax=Chryseolinea sp. T2 TaxID=3129255 RepID=UPI003077A366